MEFKSIGLFIVTLNVVWSSNCGSEDLNTLFDGGGGRCNAEDTWTFRNAPASIRSNNDVSNFLAPGTSSSCITSQALPLTGEGVIEVNFYTKSTQNDDYVSVTIYESVENNVVGKATFSQNDNEIKDGWNNLRIILDGAGNYNGYVMITGQASSDSVILLESVCYKAPSVEEKLPSLDKISKLTTNYKAPDIYVLQTQSIFSDLVSPKVATQVGVNDDIITEERAMRFIDFDDFWTPLTISLAVIIPVLILVLLGWGCYALGKRKGAQQEPEIIYEDVNTIPKPYLVPRVKSVYTESVAESSYGGRNNNIYSV